jgi:hypothetical protein
MSKAPALALPERTPYALDQPLPADVVAGLRVWPGYRRYPVFGWRWFVGRSFIFCSLVIAYAVFVAIGVGMATGSVYRTLMSTVYFAAAFIVMSTAGPFLAALVRHARWPLRRERVCIVLAVLLGIVASGVADHHASNYLIEQLPEVYESTSFESQSKQSISEKITVFGVLSSLLFYGAFGGGLALYAYFRELGRWQRSHQAEALAAVHAQKQQADLRLGVLQAQVEPHFLFNTLASVRALVRERPEQAEATLDALVDYLRASIPKLRNESVSMHSTLGQQLEMCASYLELMRLRTDGRLHYAVVAEPALRELPFPPMLLITLVENAIKHGIEPKPGPGKVEIITDIVTDTAMDPVVKGDAPILRVQVIDNGLGLQPGIGGGLGLANVRAQLETRFAERARFDLRSAPGGGTIAELRLPLEDADVSLNAVAWPRDDDRQMPA